MLASHRDPWSGYRVTPEHLREGDVCLAMSVLYRPGEELESHYTEPPESRYFGKLLEDLDDVEADAEAAERPDGARPRRARRVPARRDRARSLRRGRVSPRHDPGEIEANIKTLARKAWRM